MTGEERGGLCILDASDSGIITAITFRTAVLSVRTAHGSHFRTASIVTRRHHATRAVVRTLLLIVRTHSRVGRTSNSNGECLHKRVT